MNWMRSLSKTRRHIIGCLCILKEAVGDAEKRARDQKLLNKGEDDDKKVKSAISIP
jgi:hypothetical protein